jgi:hypothetical protein
MANTFKKIQTVTVGSGGAANIEFTSIPQTFTDLKIVLSGRNTANDPGFDVQFNSLTTNLTMKDVYGSGAAVSSNNFTTITGYMARSTYTASVFGNAEIYIPNYTSANFKSVSMESVAENNSTATAMSLSAGLWSATAAITSIKLVPNGSGNFAQYSTATLYGVADVPAAGNAKATGGIITYDDTYVYHTFPWSGTFTPLTSLTADYLVVAGGAGGGGGYAGGGGGAGGLRCTVGATGGGGSLETPLSLTATAYTVTVGAGGAGGNGVVGVNGNNSVFGSITSTGGGGGGYFQNVGSNGGAGGGGAANNSAPTKIGGTGTTNQGYGGGTGYGNTSTYFAAGGGGGANAIGGSGNATGTAGNGGAGVATSISGSSVTYAGGGGGGASTVAGTGGSGGGGTGGLAGSVGTTGTTNTGGGGGGGGGNWSAQFSAGVAGGSGIVIVRYAK